MAIRILVVGHGIAAIHEVAVAKAFKTLGHEVESFYWATYFQSHSYFLRQWRRIQNKFLFGPTIRRINRDLALKAVKDSPELIFI